MLLYLASMLIDHYPDCPSFLKLLTCFLTVLLTLPCLVCTVILVISHFVPYCELYELIVLSFGTESIQNMALPYSPPLTWSIHVGSSTRGAHYNNRFRNRLLKTLIIYTHIICNSKSTSAPGHEHGYNELWYDRMTGFTRTYLVSHT